MSPSESSVGLRPEGIEAMKKIIALILFIAPLVVFEMTSRHGFFPAKAKLLVPKEETAKLQVEITDDTEKSQLNFIHSVIDLPIPDIKHIQLWVAGSGSSVAVTDADMDGFPDIYVTSMNVNQPNRLFRNQGDGTFKDETQRFFPQRSNDRYISLKSTFFDCDNDGYQDLLQLTSSCPILYRNMQGKGFQNITPQAGLNVCKAVYGNALDYNRDGKLDIIYASYDILGGENQMDNFFQSDTSHQFSALFENDGTCRFKEVKNSGIKDVGLTHAIGVLDIRNNNRNDIWFVTDTGTDKVFYDNGDGTYTDSRDALKWAFNRHGMSFDVLYEKEQPHPYVYVSHVYKPAYLVEGNALWKLDSPNNFTNVADDYNVSRCGHSWGAKFVDLDHDMDEDLIVTNGFFSQDPNKSYNFPLALLGTTHRDYMRMAKNWPAVKQASLYGYEKNCIFMREGERFVKPEAPNPLTEDTYDGRGVALIDVNNTGSPSVLIVNQRQPLKIFGVKQLNQNNWIGLKFKGTCSNKDALGTKVTLVTDQGSQTRWYYPTNGYASQTESALQFGLGSNAALKEVIVRWPLGLEEKFTDLKLNAYNILNEGAHCVAKN